MKIALRYHEQFLSVFYETLRRHKRQANFTSLELAERLGVEKTTVDKWLRAESAAQGGNLIALFKLFGSDFINDLIRPFGFLGTCEFDGGQSNPFLVNATAGDLISELSNALRDGRIDHTEAPEVRKQLRSLINDATALLNNLETISPPTKKGSRHA